MVSISHGLRFRWDVGRGVRRSAVRPPGHRRGAATSPSGRNPTATGEIFQIPIAALFTPIVTQIPLMRLRPRPPVNPFWVAAVPRCRRRRDATRSLREDKLKVMRARFLIKFLTF